MDNKSLHKRKRQKIRTNSKDKDHNGKKSNINFHYIPQKMEGVILTVILGALPIVATLYMYIRLTRGTFNGTQDLSGKTTIITGANSGIGYYTALDFATRNARVILAGRSLERSEAAAAAIRSETGNSNVVAWKLDVSLMSSVRAFVAKFKKDEKRLDILVNNAGVAGLELARTEEGLEVTMASNHLGHFLLTNLLLGELKRSAPSRVVNVSSMAHRLADLELDNINSQRLFNRSKIYANTKLCNILFTRELAKRLANSGVTTYSLHPGVVNTNVWRSMRFPVKQIVTLLRRMWFKTSEEGAQTTLYCALADKIEPLSGAYFSDCKEASTSAAAQDDLMATNLWDVSEDITGL